MKPMGYDEDTAEELRAKMDEARALVDTHMQSGNEPPSEIAYPEDRYSVACIGCGIEAHLQLIPHRDSDNLIVGWVFCCEGCRPQVIGRRMWWGEQKPEDNS